MLTTTERATAGDTFPLASQDETPEHPTRRSHRHFRRCHTSVVFFYCNSQIHYVNRSVVVTNHCSMDLIMADFLMFLSSMAE